MSQDTLRGFIEYRNWDKNPVRILFKSTREDQEKTLGLEELSGFYVHDEYYVKATVKVDDNPIRGEEMSYSRIQQTRTETVFLRMLARGVKSLGYYVDARGRQNFYIVTGDYSYELLTNYQYILKRNNSSSLVTNDSYKIELQEYFSDCPTVQSRTQSLTYSEKSLSKLFVAYYAKCTDNKPVVAPRVDPLQLQYGVLLGASATKYILKSNPINGMPDSGFPFSYSISGGAYFNLVIPRTRKRLSVYNDLLFVSGKLEFSSEDKSNNTVHSQREVKLGYSYLKVNSMFRYQLPVSSFYVFFNAGMANGFALSEVNYDRQRSIYTTPQWATVERKALSSTRKYEQGFLTGIGVAFKRYSVELRHERGNGMSTYANFNSVSRRYFLLMGYRF